MTDLSKYTLYVNNHCPQCGVVSDYLKRNSIACPIVNVDEPGAEPPITLMVFPALMNDQKLLAYGEDILRYLDGV